MSSTEARGSWGSRVGFILAAAGSAIGLGNIWGFPTRVGQGGGAVFVLVYLACVFLVCAPILMAELAVGRASRRSPVGALRVLLPGTRWWVVGALGVLAGVGILSFYAVIAGWTLAYVYFSASGTLTSVPAGELFARFTANGPLTTGLALIILALTAAILWKGVQGGIERASRAMMPALFVLLVVLAARALTLPGASAGIAYYLRPDPSKLLDPRIVSTALGQAFFSLSLGMGTMITYGSYMRRADSIAVGALWVVVLDTAIALLAGFVVFPAGFSIPGFDPASSGTGLIFTVLPRLFGSMPGGHLFGAAFFLLLVLAALTSTISLLEVPVAYLIDEHGWTRHRAVAAVTALTFVLATPSALSNGASAALTRLPGLGMGFLDLMAHLWNDFALPLGGVLLSVVVGYAWGIDCALDELRAEGARMPGARLWGGLIRYLCPVAIGGILLGAVLG
ncbi:MAG: sodium-dependent transporter [Myxococcales bacterium]|nr:sodium-dependent transporter [Myxococcota bacterium]MDW8280144.1 sodium-dependent transporter [Myxococcales bacterium]